MKISRHHLATFLAIVEALICSSVTAEDYPVWNLSDVSKTLQLSAGESPIIIRSKDFGKQDYPNNIHHKMILIARDEPLVFTFHFRHFNVEFEEDCSYDALNLRDIPFCGGWQEGREFPFLVMDWEQFTLEFITDELVSRPGFEVVVIPELAVNYNSTS